MKKLNETSLQNYLRRFETKKFFSVQESVRFYHFDCLGSAKLTSNISISIGKTDPYGNMEVQRVKVRSWASTKKQL